MRPASILRTSFDASSSAWPGATSAISLTVNCRFERCSVVGPRPRSMRRDVVDAHRAGRRRHRQPADLLDVAPLVLEHADLDRVLLLAFLVERDLVVAGHREPQRVADGRHPHAEVGGALAVDRDVDFRVRDVERDLRPRSGSAASAPPRAPASSTRRSVAGRARGCSRRSRSRRCPSPLPSALRERDATAGSSGCAASRRRISVMICACVFLRSSSGSA